MGRHYIVTPAEYLAALRVLGWFWTDTRHMRNPKLGRAAEPVKLVRWALGR